ncbi:TolC family protein [Seonamhaeicola sp.]|uniref:TolC family protein n=1 Tax=Seonamhaeicola sp. TaxID=1912245 RepID=UPI003561447F
MIYKLISSFFCVLTIGVGNTKAQEKWNLKKCIDYALQNNLSIKRQEIDYQLHKIELKNSKQDRLPDLDLDTYYGLNIGETQVIDNDQYITVTDPIHNLSLSLNGSVSVFSGLYQKNTIKQNNRNLMASLAQTDKMRNDIALQITAQYLQVLLDKELLNVVREQFDVSKQQAVRTKKLVDVGSQAMGSYLEIKSQAAKEALAVTQQENKLFIALLDLAQLLDLEDIENFDVVSPNIPAIQELELENPKVVYEMALGIMPQIKASQYSLESSELGVAVAKSGYSPSVSLGYEWSTSAYWYVNDKYNSNSSFDDQNADNKNLYVYLYVSIPIFNKFSTRNSLRRAQINLLDANYSLQQEKLTLRKEIQQAYADALASYNNYLSSSETVKSYKVSFRYTEQKFNVGLVNSVDYNVAKSDYTSAKSDLLQAKYEYVLRKKILDFYKGIFITL